MRASKTYKKLLLATVMIVISLLVGCSSVKIVPDVTGLREYKAVSMLREKLGKKIVTTVEYEYSDSIEKDCVARTVPNAGEEYFDGQVMIIYLSKGINKEMPNIIGSTKTEAADKLKQMGFDVDFTEKFDDSEQGTVIGCQFASGANLNDYVGNIELVVSKGSLQSFIDTTEEVGYEDLLRYPESNQSKPLRMSVKITKIDESKIFGITYSTAYWATYNGETVILYDNRTVQEPAILVGDKAVVYGYGNGTSTINIKEKEYQGSLLFGFSYNKTVDSYDVPCINVEYFDLK